LILFRMIFRLKNQTVDDSDLMKIGWAENMHLNSIFQEHIYHENFIFLLHNVIKCDNI